MISRMADPQNPLRLRKRHGDGSRRNATAADGARLVELQSFRGAVLGGLIVIVLFSLLWAMLTALLERVLPWMTVVLGYLVGYTVRRSGRGVDWRFPAVAAFLAIAGSLLANVVVAASVTADEFGTGTISILRAVTSMTWPVFFDEVWNVADAVFAAAAAIVAAFFAPRHLSRQEYYALRLWREQNP